MNARRCAWLVLVTLVLILASSAMAVAEPIRVEAGESIKAAVEGAADGDTVLVAAGFFSGPGNRGMEIEDKSLTIIAEDGPEATTICGLLMDGLFRITGSGSETVTIRGFELYRTERQFGGAIYVRMATLHLEQCYLHNCTAIHNPPGTGYGGALAVWEGAVAHVTLCTFAENTAQGYTHTPGFGTSIYTDNGASTVVEQCLFMNDVNSMATGVLHADGEIFVEHCIFSGGYPPGWNVSGSEYLEIDPGVCGSGNPHPYAPCSDSMCLPENNPWGAYIGALDVNCGPCNSPVESLSWGRIKALYRGSAD